MYVNEMYPVAGLGAPPRAGVPALAGWRQDGNDDEISSPVGQLGAALTLNKSDLRNRAHLRTMGLARC